VIEELLGVGPQRWVLLWLSKHDKGQKEGAAAAAAAAAVVSSKAG
jgi:hypothetical protein